MRGEEIVEKMFETAVREKFQHLKRTNDPEVVFQTWALLVKEGRPAEHFQKHPWGPETTLEEALYSLELLFDRVLEQVKNHK
jgi:hypothetical protein